MFVGYMASGAGLLSVAQQLDQNGEPGGDGIPSTETRVSALYTMYRLYIFK